MKERLNVFLLTDIEGIANVDSIDDIDRSTDRFKESCDKLCRSINLSVQTCFDAGADRVFYLDGHGGGGSVNEDAIDPRAEKCSIAQWQELLKRGDIDCQIELGAHARAGTIGGFLDHTISSKRIYSISINGIEMSEFSIHAIFCAKHGVPIVAVVGDEAACEQAREYVPDIYTGALKCATVRNRATTYPDADKILCDTVRTALENRDSVSLISFCEPLTVEQIFYRTDMCEAALARSADAVRLDARTLSKTVPVICSYSDLKF